MTSAALLEQYRPALTGHCYRMLGSVVDAGDWTPSRPASASASIP